LSDSSLMLFVAIIVAGIAGVALGYVLTVYVCLLYTSDAADE